MAEPNKTEATANPNSPELSPKPYSTVFIESIVPLITAVSNPNKNPPNAVYYLNYILPILIVLLISYYFPLLCSLNHSSNLVPFSSGKFSYI